MAVCLSIVCEDTYIYYDCIRRIFQFIEDLFYCFPIFLFQALLLSVETGIQPSAYIDAGNSMVHRNSDLLLGPGLRSLSESSSSCNPDCESGSNFQFNLVHRSNSLSSDGNNSPTSVMGSQHAVCNSSPPPDSSNLLIVSEEWNILEVPEVDYEFSAKVQRTVDSRPGLLSSSHTDEKISTNCEEAFRAKRKVGPNGGYDDGPYPIKPLNRGLSDVLCVQKSSVLPPDTVRKETTVSSSSSRKDSATSKKDSVAWNSVSEKTGSGEEEDRGPKDEYISSRRRRRLNLIVPNPRKPRQADYMCSLCMEMYQVVVGDNPWWAVYSQQCPVCKQQQVPRIDINSASNAIELDPNVMALYGEGLEDSGDDECEGGSEEEDEVEKEEDDEAVAAAAAEADQEDLRRDVHPFDGEGLLAVEEASKLLVLMCHARSCSGHHASPKHAEICKVRDTLVLLLLILE